MPVCCSHAPAVKNISIDDNDNDANNNDDDDDNDGDDDDDNHLMWEGGDGHSLSSPGDERSWTRRHVRVVDRTSGHVAEKEGLEN